MYPDEAILPAYIDHRLEWINIKHLTDHFNTLYTEIYLKKSKNYFEICENLDEISDILIRSYQDEELLEIFGWMVAINPVGQV